MDMKQIDTRVNETVKRLTYTGLVKYLTSHDIKSLGNPRRKALYIDRLTAYLDIYKEFGYRQLLKQYYASKTWRKAIATVYKKYCNDSSTLLDVKGTVYVLYSTYLERKAKGYKDYQVSDSVLLDRASHRIASKVWYYRYKLGMPLKQAVDYLILPVRKADQPLYLQEEKQVYIQYLDMTCEKVIAEAIADKVRNKSRMTIYRYAIRYGMKSNELQEYINRLLGYRAI